VESAGGELELGHCGAHQTHPGVVQFAVRAHIGGAHVGVGGGVVAKAFALNLAGLRDSGLDRLRTFTQSCVSQLHMIHTRHFDVAKRVDAVEQGAADPFLVAGDCAGRAGALFDRIAMPAAGAGVHGGDEHEVGGEGERALRARDSDDLIFERLAQGFESALAELRELIQKKDAPKILKLVGWPRSCACTFAN